MHQHDTQEQIYVITHGRGMMAVGDEERELVAGTLVFVPPATPHTIRNAPMTYVSATSPPFEDALMGWLYRER